jgi:mono/diheme cytochrome c family protein
MLRRYAVVAVITLAVLLAGQSAFIYAGTADLAAGKRIYTQVCASCHGLDGKGPGVMKFNPPAADLTSQQVQAKLDSGLYKSIHEGRPNTSMGAWKHALSEEEIRDVLAYVRTFGQGSSTP